MPAASFGPFNEKFKDYFKFDFMALEASNTERYAEIKVCSSFSHRLTTVGIGLFYNSVKRKSLKLRHTLQNKPLVLGVLLCTNC